MGGGAAELLQELRDPGAQGRDEADHPGAARIHALKSESVSGSYYVLAGGHLGFSTGLRRCGDVGVSCAGCGENLLLLNFNSCNLG